MHDYQIIPITLDFLEGYCAALDSVARERQYLAFLEGPSEAKARAFVLENLQGYWPHFIALCEGKVVGWCDITALHRPVFAHAGTLGLGVIAPYRGRGIGEALMRAALNQAQSKGLTRIELTVRENNVRAIKLYKKLGFVVEGLHRNALCIGKEYENQISMALLFE
ncbi:MAG: GNAT family N-acetyltransferase [Gammaproteobacteria bacterium]|nr:GNAT family N-acetyltransferase [Gammaproteobacteria bacterium]